MLQLIDRGKIYFYIALLLILLSIHNLNSINFLNNFFKIKKIHLISDIEKNLSEEIVASLNNFYNFNIFSINSSEIHQILDDYNFIDEYKIRKEYPSAIKIELKQTKILAYFFEDSEKILIGENKKKIRNNEIALDNLPFIVGKVNINEFFVLKKKLIENGFELNDFDTFYFFKSKRWDLSYKDKIIVKLPIKDIDFSLTLFRGMLENSSIQGVKVIDLRIKNSIIIS